MERQGALADASLTGAHGDEVPDPGEPVDNPGALLGDLLEDSRTHRHTRNVLIALHVSPRALPLGHPTLSRAPLRKARSRSRGSFAALIPLCRPSPSPRQTCSPGSPAALVSGVAYIDPRSPRRGVAGLEPGSKDWGRKRRKESMGLVGGYFGGSGPPQDEVFHRLRNRAPQGDNGGPRT